MTTINKTLLKTIRADLEKEFAKIAKKHNLTSLTIGSFRFDDGQFHGKLEGTSAVGAAKREAANSNELMSFGFTASGAKKPFKFGGREFVIVGVRRTRFAIQCQATDKVYTASIEQVMNSVRANHPKYLAKTAR